MTFAKPVSILGGVRTMMRGKNEGGGREREGRATVYNSAEL